MGLLFGIFSLAYYLFCKTKSQEWKSKYLWYIGLGYIILTFLVACILYLPSVLNTNSFPAVPELDKSIHNYNVAMLKWDSKYCGDISNNTWRERCTAELTGNFAWCSNLIDGVNKDYEFYNDCLWTTALYKEDTMGIEWCDKVVGEEEKKYFCRAGLLGDIRECEKISIGSTIGKLNAETCAGIVIEKTKDATFCETYDFSKLGTDSDICYAKLSSILNDKSLCEKIKNIQSKEFCLS